ncbi:hypothetical protein M0R45_018801 [Rubus argutus]|uniref:J domain-containing protein n=1 Tax=Rubus argutus TaxID=59490 RepID=A0AAW1X4D9_RUBAR
MDSEENSPYDILGANQNMSSDNIKKRYWKMSLMVHPDKCSHPQAHQAFVKLNKAFKDLQDPEKLIAADQSREVKISDNSTGYSIGVYPTGNPVPVPSHILELRELTGAEAAVKVFWRISQNALWFLFASAGELRAMREAAQWRKLQGISMEGDDELLADMDVKCQPKRDEWMTTLPPERKPGGMPTQSTKFSSSVKEGRGDTSAWTDTPSDRAQKAKMDYLEAYNETASLASNEEDKKKKSLDADLVDKYNKERRAKSLKTWRKVLTSRFSAGSYQRNFL